MGEYQNRMLIKLAATLAAIAVLSLNVVLLLQILGVQIPSLES